MNRILKYLNKPKDFLGYKIIVDDLISRMQIDNELEAPLFFSSEETAEAWITWSGCPAEYIIAEASLTDLYNYFGRWESLDYYFINNNAFYVSLVHLD